MERTLLTHAEIAGDPCSCPDVTMTARPPRRLLFCMAAAQHVRRPTQHHCKRWRGAMMGFARIWDLLYELVSQWPGKMACRIGEVSSRSLPCVVNTAAAHKVCPVFKFF